MKRKIVKYAAISGKPGQRYISFTFAFDSFLISDIKAIDGRVWDKKLKQWKIPLTLPNAYKSRELGFMFSESLRAWANESFLKHKRKDLVIPGLKGVLKNFQKEGVLQIDRWDGRALLADDMGLGKTVQAIAWAQLNINKSLPIIVVCTATGKYFWRNMFMEWTDINKIRVLNGQTPRNILAGNVFILNFGIVSYWVKELIKLNARTLIVDESHYIKNSTPLRSKAVAKLSADIEYVIELSGTPIENKTSEIYNQIKIARPLLFPNKWTFLHTYCDPKNNGFGWEFNGLTNGEELFKILTENVMIRRKKEDVLSELPEKIFITIPLDIDNRKEYNTAFDDFVNYIRNSVEKELKEQLTSFMEKYEIETIDFGSRQLERIKDEKESKINELTKLEALKQICVRGKLKSVITWIDEFLEKGDKLVVFCEHLFVIDELMAKYGKIAVKIDGSVANNKRDGIVKVFQTNPKIRLFIGNSAAQEQVTLTRACTLVHVEYPWTPGKFKQRCDRVHRISQTRGVIIYSLVAVNTVEEKIIEILNKKMKILDAVLDGKPMEQNANILIDIVNFYKDGKRKN